MILFSIRNMLENIPNNTAQTTTYTRRYHSGTFPPILGMFLQAFSVREVTIVSLSNSGVEGVILQDMASYSLIGLIIDNTI